MASTQFAYGTIISPEFLNSIFYTPGTSGRGIQFDGVNADGHLPKIVSAFIADAAVTTQLIDAGAVTSVKIQDGAVLNSKLGEGAVGASKIADGAVGSAKIADAAVIGAKIADSAVTASKIVNGAVTTNKIADGNVTAAKLAGTVAGRYLAIDSINGMSVNLNASHFEPGALAGEYDTAQLSAAARSGLCTFSTADASKALFTQWLELDFGTPIYVEADPTYGDVYECRATILGSAAWEIMDCRVTWEWPDDVNKRAMLYPNRNSLYGAPAGAATLDRYEGYQIYWTHDAAQSNNISVRFRFLKGMFFALRTYNTQRAMVAIRPRQAVAGG